MTFYFFNFKNVSVQSSDAQTETSTETFFS